MSYHMPKKAIVAMPATTRSRATTRLSTGTNAMKRMLIALLFFNSLAIADEPTVIEVVPSGYIVAGKTLKTSAELDSEVARLELKEARVVPSNQASYAQVRAAVQIMQQHHIFIGIVGYKE